MERNVKRISSIQSDILVLEDEIMNLRHDLDDGLDENTEDEIILRKSGNENREGKHFFSDDNASFDSFLDIPRKKPKFEYSPLKERYMETINKRKKYIEENLREKESYETEGCTFRPQINEASRHIQTPLSKRRKEIEQTPQPKRFIDPNSERIASQLSPEERMRYRYHKRDHESLTNGQPGRKLTPKQVQESASRLSKAKKVQEDIQVVEKKTIAKRTINRLYESSLHVPNQDQVDNADTKSVSVSSDDCNQHINELFTHSVERSNNLERIKKENEKMLKERELNQCTFKPAIHRSPFKSMYSEIFAEPKVEQKQGIILTPRKTKNRIHDNISDKDVNDVMSEIESQIPY